MLAVNGKAELLQHVGNALYREDGSPVANSPVTGAVKPHHQAIPDQGDLPDVAVGGHILDAAHTLGRQLLNSQGCCKGKVEISSH